MNTTRLFFVCTSGEIKDTFFPTGRVQYVFGLFTNSFTILSELSHGKLSEYLSYAF